ncbi:hypothetical protein [Ruania zhangjianzhongii]|uniref:hypothetical protein n=1 Tax=Ruania zhangjianzhongii TaxID=2603206 RepID=UPI0011C6F230|nr:hypothetical protein [Ruania zhangjianzhongii]
MTSTLMTGARRATAVAAAALLLVAGCDDGADQAAPPEAPAEQETEAAGEEPTDAAEDAPDDGSAEEEGADAGEDAGGEDEAGSDGEEPAEDASAERISGDPCTDLSADEVGGVLGNEVGDREEVPGQDAPAPEGAGGEGMVICAYHADTPDVPSAVLYWVMPMDYPDEMPEDVQAEQDENRVSQFVAGGEEIDVEGASQATVEISSGGNVMQVTIMAAVGGAVLNTSLVAEDGALDESDIATAVELAELAISKA